MNSVKQSILAGIFFTMIVFAIPGCTDPAAYRQDTPVMPKIEGCEVQRYEVRSPKAGTEVLYVARCKETKTTSITSQYSCGKSCTKKVTTITTVEGTPEDGSTGQK